jgi:hypothetical protein
MKKARRLLLGFVGAAVGAFAMATYGLAWRMASQALGFGTIVCGFQDGGGSRPIVVTSICDAIAGAVLGWATAELILSRSATSKCRLNASSVVTGAAILLAYSVGFFGVFVIVCAVGPGLAKLVSHFETREFALQQFILAGVVLNPKLWWCRAVLRSASQMEKAAYAELERAKAASGKASVDAVTLSPA